jgi:hypothetical protein
MVFSKSYCNVNPKLRISGTFSPNWVKAGETVPAYVKRPCDAYIAISRVRRNDVHSIIRTLVCLGVFTSIDMDMQHGHLNAEYPSSCLCCMSMSKLHVHVHVACPCQCCMSMPILHVHFHAACSSPSSMSMSMLQIQVHTAMT